MPSNALTLAKDGSSDGRVDLFDHRDAIFSVANFLAHHGWKPGIKPPAPARGPLPLQPEQLLR